MKKSFGHVLFGVIIGVSISFSPQIYGASAKLMGKEVDKQLEVKLNDKVIGQAAVIEGTSYLPVRALANEFQLDVAVNTTTITLSSPSAEENAKEAQRQQDESDKSTKIRTLTSQIELSKEKIAGYEESVTFCEKRVTETKANVDYLANTGKGDQVQKDLTKQSYDAAVAALENVNSLLAAEKINLADLEAQLAALQK
jgi:hypothetical protein